MDLRPLGVVLLAWGVTTSAAQSPGLAFDVVSVKRNVSRSFPVAPEARSGGSFVATNTTVEWIVRFAYDLPGYRLVGGPDWIRRDRFDIEARAGREASSEEVRRMVQSLLERRFQLVVSQERRTGSTYALLLERDDKRLGPNLRPSQADCTTAPGEGTMEEQRTPNGGVSTRRTCSPMAVLVSSLADELQGPVDDQTALTGLWDSELSYTGPSRRNADPAPIARDSNEAPALFTAVREQLGLRLERGTGLVDVLVIESVAQPTEN